MHRAREGPRHLSTRRAWAACTIAGVLAFIASYLFGRIPDLKACGPSGGLSAIIAFEFVQSPADVAVLFGAEPCRSALVAAQRTGLLLDSLWFIPAYTVFLVLAARASCATWWRWVTAILLIAGLSDEVEGAILWSILNALPSTQGQIDALWIAVHLKFALLALGTLLIGWALMPRRVGWRLLPGLVVAVGGWFAGLRLALGDDISAMMLAFSASWIALLAIGVTASIWPSLFAVRGGSPPMPTRPAA